jgi:hypothetical protein
MPCTVTATAPCGLQYNSSRVQLETLLLLLGAINGTVDWPTNLDNAREAGLTCLSIGQLKAKFAQQVCEGVTDVDCSVFDCYQESDLWAMVTMLGCEVIDGL